MITEFLFEIQKVMYTNFKEHQPFMTFLICVDYWKVNGENTLEPSFRIHLTY